MQVTPDRLALKLADPKLTASLSHFVRARVPESDAEDIVQATITDALDAAQHPEQDEEIVRWVHGICRHKVIDWFRRARREVPRDLESGEDGPVAAAAESAPQSAMDLLRWAKKELPEGEEHAKTLEWMLREGEGEKLETIAAEANLPAPRVRQRVSRLRRYYKARWAAQAAAVAALLLVALAIVLALRSHKQERVAPAPGPSILPSSMPTMEPPGPAPLPPERPATSGEPQDVAPPQDLGPQDAAPKPLKPPTFRSGPTSVPVPTGSAAPPMMKKPSFKPRPVKADSIDPSWAAPASSAPVPPPPAPTKPINGWGEKGSSK
jgi:RNA polymerase sigma factor (sigma-70 family)